MRRSLEEYYQEIDEYPDDIKFCVKALCFDDIANIHGQEIAQALWQRIGYGGKYVNGFVAIPGWVERKGGLIIGFQECERANQLLKDIINESKTNSPAP